MENSELNISHVSVDDVRGDTCKISKLELIGNYSIQTVDGKSEYFNDLSQLRYYKEPVDTEDVDLHLGGIEVKEKTITADTEKENTVTANERSSRIYFLLKWVSENLDLIRAKDSNKIEHRLQPDFICTRGPIQKLLFTPYAKYTGWILCASKFKGIIYLSYNWSDDKIEQKSNFTPEQKCIMKWRHSFAEYVIR